MAIEDVDSFANRPAYRRIGLYLLGLIMVGVAGGVLIYLVSMQQLGWTLDSAGVTSLRAEQRGLAVTFGGTGRDRKGPPIPAFNGELPPVQLYLSPTTVAYFQRVGGNYERLLAPWRAYAAQRSLRLSEVTRLQDLEVRPGSVLLLPSAAALSEPEKLALLDYRNHGGSVLLTWAAGSHDAQGQWKGWDFLEAMGSLRVAGEVDRAEGSFYLCLAGLAPVNNRLAAGSLLSLGQSAEAPLRLIGEYRAARITDAARQSASSRQAEGGVVFAEGAGGQGRAVAYAFSENAWAYRAEALYNLVDDTLGWLARQPMLLPADWPHGQRSATVLAMDVSTDFDQALAFADTLKKQNDPASYFLLSNEAGAHPDTVRRLAREGDVGALGDSETPFAGQNSATQGQRIARMQAELDRLLPVPGQLKGFHSPGERDDRRTEPLLYEAGLRHHLTPPAPSEALLPLFPEFRQTDPKDRFIKLPRALRDDTALGAVAPADVLAGLQSDQDLARELGGLGVLSLHSALYGPESPVRLALPALLEHIHRDTGSVWLATASQVSAWWREREAFKMAVRYYGKRVEFDVSVVGREAVNGGTLVLMLPAANRLPVIAGVKVGMPLPKLRQLDPFRVALVFESLAEGNYIYQATFP